MSTRSSITAKLSDGSYASIYCHFDGYPECVGEMLMTHYIHQDKIDQLLALGDLSSLHENCDKPKGHSYHTPIDGYTIAYHRDRGYKLNISTASTPGLALANGPGTQEYNYRWDGEKLSY